MYTYTMNLKEYTYNIFIGENYFNEILDRILQTHPYNKIMVITDQTVSELYLNAFSIHPDTFIETFVVSDGEKSKSIETASQIYEKLAEGNFTRKDLILALGGGVVGDLAGFVASTYLRGIDYIQVPTSLLAQVDSSVGGKVAINIPQGKNLVGSFYQPKAVYIDVAFLKTLPIREIKSGLGEIIKYAMLVDEGLVEKLTNLSLETLYSHLQEIVLKCVEIKGRYVVEDEKESFLRMHLNLGHTIGHAVESYENYEVSHGECVLIGMYYMAKLSENQTVMITLDRLLNAFEINNIYNYNWSDLIPYMKRDKKNSGYDINLVMFKNVGETEIVKIPFEVFEASIRRY
ncbi:MAG: 3-dehydroquinate synthase [Clostridia bacterium]|nr:3-dehydroquinate synthase [Clostridia bacterium]